MKPVDVGCAGGGTAELFAPYFGEGGSLESYFPEEFSFDEFAIALERPDLIHNAALIGVYRDYLHTFSDNLRDDLLPLMGRQGVLLEQKVFELYRLVELEGREGCKSTVVGAFITCFDKLSGKEQKSILDGHYEKAEAPLAALKASEDVEYIKETLLPDFLGTVEATALDWACLQRMQHYQGLNQPKATQWFYQHLTPGAKAKLTAQEAEAQNLPPNSRLPVPKVGEFTYFDKAPIGATAKKALDALIDKGKKGLTT